MIELLISLIKILKDIHGKLWDNYWELNTNYDSLYVLSFHRKYEYAFCNQ